MQVSDFASTTSSCAYTAGVQTPGSRNIHTSTYSSVTITTINRALHLQVPSVLYKDTDLSEVFRPRFQWLIGFRAKDTDFSTWLRPRLHRFDRLPCERSKRYGSLSRIVSTAPTVDCLPCYQYKGTGLALFRPKLSTG